MSAHAPLYLSLKKVPFSDKTAYEMRRRGVWTWLVKGGDGRLWIDIAGLQKFMRARAPVWRTKVDLAGLFQLASEFDFESMEVAQS